MKTTLARWLARRAERQARNIRRALRDHTRRELTTAALADKRARGLRLFAAWNTRQTIEELVNGEGGIVGMVYGRKLTRLERWSARLKACLPISHFQFRISHSH